MMNRKWCSSDPLVKPPAPVTLAARRVGFSRFAFHLSGVNSRTWLWLMSGRRVSTSFKHSQGSTPCSRQLAISV